MHTNSTRRGLGCNSLPRVLYGYCSVLCQVSCLKDILVNHPTCKGKTQDDCRFLRSHIQ